MRNGLLLVALCGAVVANGLFLDAIPPSRQALFLALGILAYLHGRYLPARRGPALIGLCAVPAAAVAVWSVSTAVGAVLALVVFLALPWLLGHFQLGQAGRVAQLEREQEFVRLRERARIAADMHDSLGHDLALIALRAGALELAAGMTDANRAAATQLRESAVSATDRLRHTVHLLREAGVPPLPSSLSELVDGACAAGMTVHVTGPDSADPTVHRVVQESLTNASRHAPGAPVHLAVTQQPTHTTVTIHNPARGTPTAASRGTGLAGLQERVTLLGGTFEAVHTDGTFTVTATIPAGGAG
ncbi:histidine kinase [Actinoplanes sp. NPDC051470]|uniref:sensor histidine kinase n=1 Tax=unclassified Actinoplanes TaxID=2626549 RepID=UPI003440014A